MKYLILILALLASAPSYGNDWIARHIFKVFIRTEQGFAGGTGFTVTGPSGKTYIMTNAHVCGNSFTMNEFNEHDGVLYEDAPVVYSDPEADLCVLENLSGLKGLQLGTELRPLDRIYIFGHPGLGHLTKSSGFIQDFFGGEIWSTAKVLPGSSGSPMFDARTGSVVGVVHALDTRTYESIIISLATVRAFLRDL